MATLLDFGVDMRNVFDQYDQPENKLTHALYCTLAHDRKLLRPFLQWLGINDVPTLKSLEIVEQNVPGSPDDNANELEQAGLPDLCVYTQEGWAVLFEMKVQSRLTKSQLVRHVKTAQRHGFEEPQLVALTVGKSAKPLHGVKSVAWSQVYSWFDQKRDTSPWARTLVEYMEVFEARAPAEEYEIRGTITMFNGLRFDEKSPFTYREGKRILGLLADNLQSRKDLQKELKIDPIGKRRPAITRGPDVWDFIPLRIARGHPFIEFPHLTMVFRDAHALAAVTVPNGVSGIKTRLKASGIDEFHDVVTDIEKRIRPIIKRSKTAKPIIYATQRHYRSQRSQPSIDGRIEADLRTFVNSNSSRIKYQPQWIDAIYEMLIHKKSNIQFGIEMRFDYSCPVVRSPKAEGLFADSWKAMRPLIDFVLDER